MPDPTPDQRIPDREYFWNVLNTVHPEYLKKVLDHANEQRMAAKDVKMSEQLIDVSDAWW